MKLNINDQVILKGGSTVYTVKGYSGTSVVLESDVIVNYASQDMIIKYVPNESDSKNQ